MEELKSLFGEDTLNYEQFEQKLSEAQDTIKLANLKSGGYVDKGKYEKLEGQLNDLKTKYTALNDSTKDYEDLKNNYNTISEQYKELKAKSDENEKLYIIRDSGVKPKFAKFVYNEVKSTLKEGDDFQKSLDSYLKNNKEFLNETRGNYVDLQNGEKPKASNEFMNNLIRRRR